MEFRILGPLEVISDSGPVRLGGPKQRALLTVLLLNANESVSAERLALALWGEEAPAGATRTVHVHVSRLRRTLGNPDLLTTTAAGYCLRQCVLTSLTLSALSGFSTTDAARSLLVSPSTPPRCCVRRRHCGAVHRWPM